MPCRISTEPLCIYYKLESKSLRVFTQNILETEAQWMNLCLAQKAKRIDFSNSLHASSNSEPMSFPMLGI